MNIEVVHEQDGPRTTRRRRRAAQSPASDMAGTVARRRVPVRAAAAGFPAATRAPRSRMRRPWTPQMLAKATLFDGRRLAANLLSIMAVRGPVIAESEPPNLKDRTQAETDFKVNIKNRRRQTLARWPDQGASLRRKVPNTPHGPRRGNGGPANAASAVRAGRLSGGRPCVGSGSLARRSCPLQFGCSAAQRQTVGKAGSAPYRGTSVHSADVGGTLSSTGVNRATRPAAGPTLQAAKLIVLS
jgi:hypothetical protein